jgi:hypothetical protein
MFFLGDSLGNKFGSLIKNNNDETLAEENKDTEKPPEEEFIKENVHIEELVTLSSKTKEMTFLGNSLFLYLENNTFYEFDTKNKTIKEILLNEEISEVISLSAMPDLNLVFLLDKDSQIFSYSPILGKFQKNKISLPDNLDLVGTEIIMTFIYVFDKNSGQVYRYPRAEGGFGVAVTRINENLQDTEGLVDFAVDESIRIIYSDGRIKEVYKGKQRKTFSAQDKFGFIPDEIKSKENESFYYLLNREQGKIISVNRESNEQLESFESKKIQETIDFVTNETENEIYLSTESGDLLKIYK